MRNEVLQGGGYSWDLGLECFWLTSDVAPKWRNVTRIFFAPPFFVCCVFFAIFIRDRYASYKVLPWDDHSRARVYLSFSLLACAYTPGTFVLLRRLWVGGILTYLPPRPYSSTTLPNETIITVNMHAVVVSSHRGNASDTCLPTIPA